MSWISRIIGGKRAQPEGAHVFTDEDRLLSNINREKNKLRQEELENLHNKLKHMRQLQKQRAMEEEIDEIRADLYGDDDDEEEEEVNNPDAMLMQLLQQVMQKNTHISNNDNRIIKKHLTLEQLREYKKQIPQKYLDKAKKMSDNELIAFVNSYKPEFLTEYDEETLKNAFIVLRQ